MLKFTIFLWIGLIAWNLNISMAQPDNINHSEDVLQDSRKYSSHDSVNPNGIAPDGMEKLATRMENQLMAMLTKMKMQLANIASSVKRIPENFQQIGSRFFRIEHNLVYFLTFYEANVKCRQMGGHLATIQSQEELDNIISYLGKYNDYWLATNDQALEGHYVSSASKRTAPFLKWKLGEPSDKNHTLNCVALFDGFMYNDDCNMAKGYICQADNDI